MKTHNASNNIHATFYRGANDGIDMMFPGAFYTEMPEVAISYAEMEAEPCVYEFFSPTLKFANGDKLGFDADMGTKEVTDDVIEQFDGVRFDGGAQVILFGAMCCKNGVFAKSTVAEIRESERADQRRFDR